jgi:hypothetical protein
MCEKCYSYIYDFILTPLSINHILYGYIDNKALNRCSHEVADCILRALKNYIQNNTLIGCFRLFRETYEENQKILDSIEMIDIPIYFKEQRYDEWLWTKFKEVNQEESRELNHAIQVCMDAMVVKRIKCKEQLLEHFFMHKMRHLIYVLPEIHKEHTEKKGFENIKSLGSVPQDKLNYIRRMAGLSVKEEVCISMYNIDELYN